MKYITTHHLLQPEQLDEKPTAVNIPEEYIGKLICSTDLFPGNLVKVVFSNKKLSI